MTVSRIASLALCASFATTALAQQAAAPQPAPAAAASPEVAEKELAGRMAALGWLALLDRRDWGTAWETSASVFRNNVPLAAWLDNIPKSREPLGTLEDRRLVAAVYKTQLQGRPDGDYVTVVFASKFSNREVEEILTTVRDTDGRWRVTGYSTR